MVLSLADTLSAPTAVQADSVAQLLLTLAVILGAAKLGGDLAERIGQPAVLGELLVGVVLGNLGLVGVPWGRAVVADPIVDALARLGAVLLLFEVGLESTVGDILKVGGRSLTVAVLGVVAPWILGWGVGAWLLPQHTPYAHAFIGATLTATSVGITARVLQDLGQSQSSEARIILGAAVIDDVLGLVVLAGITSVISAANLGTDFSYGQLALVLVKALVFLFGALVLGRAISPRLFRWTRRLRGRGLLLTTALVFCFLLAYLAAVVGLAPIVGAYAAGLVLEKVHYEPFTNGGEHPLEELVRPIGTLLVPVFFVLMGMRVQLEAFTHPEVLGLAALLTVAAILGKQACALAGFAPGLDPIVIGIGMIPRGEVGLIFANLGLALTLHGERIVDQRLYSAVVIMVVLSTLVTPPALKWAFARRS